MPNRSAYQRYADQVALTYQHTAFRCRDQAKRSSIRAIACWKLSISDGGFAAADQRRDAANAWVNGGMGAWGHQVLCLRRTSKQAAVAKMRLPWEFYPQHLCAETVAVQASRSRLATTRTGAASTQNRGCTSGPLRPGDSAQSHQLCPPQQSHLRDGGLFTPFCGGRTSVVPRVHVPARLGASRHSSSNQRQPSRLRSTGF